jgi:hypothetical protein
MVAAVSRRWYRAPQAMRLVFVGWDPAAHGFYTNVVDLCQACGGAGEDLETDTFCAACQAEGVNWSGDTQSAAGLTLDELSATLTRLRVPLPEYVLTDLEDDRRVDAAGNVMYDYDQDPRSSR